MTLDEINVLGNLFNTTYGRSGTTNSPTRSVTASMQGDNAIVKYYSIIRLIDNSINRQLIDNERDAAIKLMKKFIEDVRKAFKKQCGRKLTMKVVDTSDIVEPITFRPQGVPTDSVFRITMVCEIK